MCLLVVCPPGAVMPDEHIDNAWTWNPDGGGFAHVGKAGKIRPFRTMQKKAFVHAYHASTRLYPESPFLVHFRLGTSGVRDLTNVHPFSVGDENNCYMAHNGVLNVKTRDTLSDTQVFARDWLTQMPADWLDNDVLVTLVEEFIGSDKMAFLRFREGRPWYDILNERLGEWEEGIWYSNDTYEPYSGTASTRYSALSSDSCMDTCLVCGESYEHRSWCSKVGMPIAGSRSAKESARTLALAVEECEICGHPLEDSQCLRCGIDWECGEKWEDCVCGHKDVSPVYPVTVRSLPSVR